jgi:hypothetical protein
MNATALSNGGLTIGKKRKEWFNTQIAFVRHNVRLCVCVCV